jgi:hypothetical protein
MLENINSGKPKIGIIYYIRIEIIFYHHLETASGEEGNCTIIKHQVYNILFNI